MRTAFAALLLGPWAVAITSPGGAQDPPEVPTVHHVEARDLKGLRADVAALVLNGREGGALWTAMLAAPLPAAEGAPRVGFWIELDGSRLLGIEETAPAKQGEASDEAETGEETPEVPETLRLEVHAYAMTAAGALAGSLGQSFRLEVEELGEALAEGGVKFFGELELEPGEYDLRILVRDTGSERFALRKLAVAVPASEETAAGLSPPLFGDVAGAWIEVRGADAGVAPSVPSALPVLAVGREIEARLEVYGDTAKKPRVLTRILDAERKPVQGVDVVLSEEASRPPFRSFAMRFELPEDLLTGNYFLETSYYAGRSKATTASHTTQIYVLGLEREENAVVWTDVQRLASLSERRREALDLASKRRASKRIAAIAEAYRSALEVLAEGSLDEAVEELGRLEAEVLESEELEAAAWLRNAEEQVIGRLARDDAECLIPILLLHIERHDRYVEEGRRRLTFQARERVVETARLYAEKSASDLAPAFAASALTDMGVSLRRAGMRVASRRMLDEVLSLDERNVVALLGLAVDHERRGEYAEAARHLRRLLDVDARSEEGRLRLALNLRRLGELGEAARLLRRVVDDGDTEWLLTLAYQELARLLLAQERAADTVRLLDAACRRLPSQQRLGVQLAYALDRSGESARAREVLAEMRTSGANGASPRLLYSRPDDVAPSGRPELVRQSMARLALLSRGLARIGEKP